MSVACLQWPAIKSLVAAQLTTCPRGRASSCGGVFSSTGARTPASLRTPARSAATPPTTRRAARRALRLPLERPGSITEDYDLGARLGAGGFGAVRAGVCRSTGAKVAVKQIYLDRLQAPCRLESELSIAAELRHPNVARLFEVYSGPDGVCMVTELCQGGDLFDRIMSDAVDGFEESVAASFTADMLSSISYLHSRQIVHRDVKPENYLLSSQRPVASLKLIDFGLSRRFEPGETLHTRVGTPYYMAPEVLQQDYNELVDVWSVGVIAYACLCGHPPFTGNTAQEVVRSVRRGAADFSAPRWESVTASAVELVAGLLTYDPEQRPPARNALEHCWVSLPCEAGHATPSPCGPQGMVAAAWESFADRSALERLALIAAAWHLRDEETCHLARSFREKGGGDGNTAAGCTPPGGAEYSSWLAAFVDPQLCAQPGVVLAAFRSLDVNGDGKISEDDVFRSFAGPRYPGGEEATALRKGLRGLAGGALDFGGFAALLGVRAGHRAEGRRGPGDTDRARCRDCRWSATSRGKAARVRSSSGGSWSTAPSITEIVVAPGRRGR